jgi:PST family polysaccharide transporter/lipopolysaccharide exporter
MLDGLIAAVRAALRRLRPEGDLASQTVKSGIWSGGINVGTRLLGIATVVVLARILGPEEFGLMGIALLVYEGLERFSRLGIGRALVQRPDENVDEYLDTAWTLQVARGIVLAGLLALGAPLVADLFAEPRVTPILYAVALSPVVSAWLNPGLVYFEKDLDLHKKFGYEMSASAARFVVAVSFALTYGTVWALVAGYLAADVAKLVASYVLHDYRPWPSVDRRQVRELLGYGKWITATSAITFLLTSGDDAVVGWLLSTAALGYYRLGYRLGKTPTMEVSQSLSTVAFPLYSKLQGDAAALAAALRKTVRLLSSVSFPAAVGVIVTAPLFVRGVLGTQWLPIVPVMQIVAVYGALSALTSAFNDIWNAIGRPDYNTKINLLRLVATGVVIYPATVTYGIVGTVAAIAGVFLLLVVPIKFYVVAGSVDTDLRTLVSELLYPAVASGVMGAVLLACRAFLSPLPAAAGFAVLAVLGVAVYLATVVVIEAHSGWEIGHDVRTMVGAVRG